MLSFYYTGVSTFKGKQTNPQKSLGGYVSSSRIPNKLLGNLFSSISGRTKEKGLEETFCIALCNEGQIDITTLTLSLILGEDEVLLGELSGFFILPALDTCDGSYFETIPAKESIPSIGELLPLNRDESISVSLPGEGLKPGQYLGLWLHRVIHPTQTQVGSLSCLDCDTLHEDFKKGVDPNQSSKEIYQLKLDY